MAEFLNRNVNLNNNFHLSFLGSENENVTSDMEHKTLMGYSYEFTYRCKVFQRNYGIIGMAKSFPIR